MSKVFELPRDRYKEFRSVLERLGFKFEEREHQIFLARYPPLTVNLFKSGKVTFGGSDPLLEREVEWHLSKLGATNLSEVTEKGGFEGRQRIGTDEAGKGDFFGPLVVAGVLVDMNSEESLRSIGVRDSKKISGKSKIGELAKGIRDTVGRDSYEIITISPPKYNDLHDRLGNVNQILGWAHARAIENILERHAAVKLAISDQFGDRGHIENALMVRGRHIELVQMTRGERDIGVAAASILARDGFLRSLARLSSKYTIEFPGGSTDVIRVARKFCKEHGRKTLSAVAKTHFSITDDI